MAHQSQGGEGGGERQEPAPLDEETTGNPYHLSKGVGTLLRVTAVVLVITMTALFLRGFIHS